MIDEIILAYKKHNENIALDDSLVNEITIAECLTVKLPEHFSQLRMNK